MGDATALDHSRGKTLAAVWCELKHKLDRRFTDLLEAGTLFSMGALAALLDDLERIAHCEYTPTVRDMMLMRHRDYLKDEFCDETLSISAADLTFRRPDQRANAPVDVVVYLVSLADLDSSHKTESQMDELVEVIKRECLELSRTPAAEKAHFFIVLTKLDLLGLETAVLSEAEVQVCSPKANPTHSPASCASGELDCGHAFCGWPV